MLYEMSSQVSFLRTSSNEHGTLVPLAKVKVLAERRTLQIERADGKRGVGNVEQERVRIDFGRGLIEWLCLLLIMRGDSSIRCPRRLVPRFRDHRVAPAMDLEDGSVSARHLRLASP